jgi:hypothetical protein
MGVHFHQRLKEKCASFVNVPTSDLRRNLCAAACRRRIPVAPVRQNRVIWGEDKQ